MKAGDFKVLVPTDFSENSRYALKYVLEEMGSHITHLILLHAYRDHELARAPLVSVQDILREKSERLLQDEIRYVSSFLPTLDLQMQAISRFDGFLAALVEVAKDEDVNLVVIGTNGHLHPRLDNRDDDPGYLVHRLNRPVLLVPKIAN